MFEKIIDKINLGIKEQIIAFFLLWFAIYGAVWTIFEPLDLSILEQNRCLWRWLYIGSTFIINVCTYFIFFFRKKLDCLGLESGDTNLISSVKYHGNPSLVQQTDGFHGKLLVVTANYDKEPLDWEIKASANKANFLTITYKPDPDLIFYARVNVLSKNKKSATSKWLRFEPKMSLPQSLEDHEEMGVPVTASNDNGLLQVNINLSKTIYNAFGHYGWKYDKVILIRARGSGIVKSIFFK